MGGLAALPSEVRGPLPQLVRDLGAALARQQTEHEALQRRLSQLQPAVINYDHKSTEQLTKAVGVLEHGLFLARESTVVFVAKIDGSVAQL